MRSNWILIIALTVAACGGGKSGSATTPAASAAASRLTLGEIALLQDGVAGLRIHTTGVVELAQEAGTWKPLGTLYADGRFVLPDGDTGQLQEDGSFTSKDGPAAFRLEGDALVMDGLRITIENGKIMGGKEGAAALTVSGTTDAGTRRAALLLIGIIAAAAK